MIRTKCEWQEDKEKRTKELIRNKEEKRGGDVLKVEIKT